jgi:hypothetical protein
MVAQRIIYDVQKRDSHLKGTSSEAAVRSMDWTTGLARGH